jgi:hypothetical protein
VQDDHADADRSDQTQRRVDQGREHDHRDADGPDHLHQPDEAVVDVEPHAAADERELEHQQPEPARDEKSRQRRQAQAARMLQVGRHAGQEDEDRRAEVRDPARQEQDGAGVREIGRIEAERVGVDEVARVVQRHQHHHHPAEQVDRIDP